MPAASSPSISSRPRNLSATSKAADADRAVQLLQEAQLFIDAAHDCHNKVRGGVASAVKLDNVAQASGVTGKTDGTAKDRR